MEDIATELNYRGGKDEWEDEIDKNEKSGAVTDGSYINDLRLSKTW